MDSRINKVCMDKVAFSHVYEDPVKSKSTGSMAIKTAEQETNHHSFFQLTSAPYQTLISG